MVTSFKGLRPAHPVAPRTLVFSALDLTAGHCRPIPPRRRLDTHKQIWLSLLWCRCSFLLGPGAHKVLFDPWNAQVESQEIPGVTGKFGLGVQNKAGQRLTEFCQENTLVVANTLFQQHKRRLYTWRSPDGQHRNQIDYILCSQRWRRSIQSANTRLELTVAQIMNSLLPNSDLN